MVNLCEVAAAMGLGKVGGWGGRNDRWGSCYANAVLQCLACTKPLTIYLLRRSHSRTCCARDWCLLCELEQHSGRCSRVLRLLVTSMQSICLEGLGGENVVDSRLQDTTFIQHAFGGRLSRRLNV
ncbi:Ubiquitin carboxyl-terminal hydrolase 15 [Abeliophyllum distichum]|uniref:Ubiquitin carboxyl-terminal hydrolase 15 n=1 Tax=Abeliophyllum distichum TaxID=126358 RepID=A0ABD1UFU8_9LAMI